MVFIYIKIISNNLNLSYNYTVLCTHFIGINFILNSYKQKTKIFMKYKSILLDKLQSEFFFTFSTLHIYIHYF